MSSRRHFSIGLSSYLGHSYDNSFNRLPYRHRAYPSLSNLLEIKPNQVGADGRWKDDEITALLNASDVIIFGYPTWMGGVLSTFKALLEGAFTLWFEQKWKDKFSGERYGKRIAGITKRWIEGASAYQTEYIKEISVADAKGWVAE